MTANGEEACRGCDEHYGEMKANIGEYIETLDEETLDRIIGLFDVLVHSAEVYEHCSIKPCAGAIARTDGAEIKRCEKCQRIY